MDFKEIYNLIGFAGVALVIIGVFALYITVWNFLYLRGVLSRFKKHFHGMDKATPERIRRYFGESTNPLECIVRDIVMVLTQTTSAPKWPTCSTSTSSL